MKLLKTLAILSLATLSSQSFAVDGFQKLKFGASETEVRKAYKQCHWEKDKQEDDELYCTNFSLGTIKNTDAVFYFIDGKFERVAIDIPVINLEGIIQALSEKYSLSSQPKEKELANPQPNNIYDFGFDKDTILIRYAYDNDMTEDIFLIYTTSDFHDKLQTKDAQSVKDQL